MQPIGRVADKRLSFIAWGAVAGRSAEIADALGGTARCFFPPGDRRPPVLVRWSLSAVATVAHVLRRRPAVVMITNPPLPAALVAWAAGRLVGAKIVLDTHPGGFGAQGDRVAARLQPLHKWLVRRVDLSLVASAKWEQQVQAWGADAMVLHEAPADWLLTPTVGHPRLRILYVGRFAGDEPWQEVLAAAAKLPEHDFNVTGDVQGSDLDFEALPDNVRLLGFMDSSGYRDAVIDADIVLCLTTEPGSIMRSAYEAVWAGRPLIISDWPAGREVFPYAVYVKNAADSLVSGIERADAGFEVLVSEAASARTLQQQRWEQQLRELTSRIF